MLGTKYDSRTDVSFGWKPRLSKTIINKAKQGNLSKEELYFLKIANDKLKLTGPNKTVIIDTYQILNEGNTFKFSTYNHGQEIYLPVITAKDLYLSGKEKIEAMIIGAAECLQEKLSNTKKHCKELQDTGLMQPFYIQYIQDSRLYKLIFNKK